MTTREERITRAAKALAYTYADTGKAIECKVCNSWIYTHKRGASAEYDALAVHLENDHPELHKELEKDFYRLNLG
ncbi:hypothetical protein LCGC14_0422280 [marine sediment metagenome]|uniref:Uncharacterized protein n=1 Tax=marine sediment metagenome TaxID=412755 RepID=A0A0F9VZV6_9ZZZZ